MTPPLLYACHFRGRADKEWTTMARVLAHSAAQHCRDWTRRIVEVAPTTVVSAARLQSHAVNSHKLEHWCDAIAAAPLGARILLIDADTVILRPLDDVWTLDFDVAYTVRDRAVMRFPINGGVLFVKVTPAAKAFIEAWRQENRRMLTLRDWMQRYRHYGGINQASFLVTLERLGEFGATALPLPCRDWNCEDSTWRLFDPARTRILHVKSALKRSVFSRYATVQSDVKAATACWRRLAREAEAVGAV